MLRVNNVHRYTLILGAWDKGIVVRVVQSNILVVCIAS